MCRGIRLKLVSTALRKLNPSRTMTSISITLGQPKFHPNSTRPGPHPLTICQLLPVVYSPALAIKPGFITYDHCPQEYERLLLDRALCQDQQPLWHSKGSQPMKSSNISPDCSPVSQSFQGNDLRIVKTRNIDRSVEQQPNMRMILTDNSSTNGNDITQGR